MKKSKSKFFNNLLWIIFLEIALYFFLTSFVANGIYYPLSLLEDHIPPSISFINYYYTPTIGAVITLVIVCLVIKKTRFILRSFLGKGAKKEHKIQVVEDTYEPTRNNTVLTLLLGLLLGFITNFLCILCAMIHGDIKLTVDFSAGMIPVFIFALLMVFIQSSSEELWMRGYMYERIRVRYPLWVAIVINSVFFGLIHMFNDGVTVLAIVGIIICGLSYSIVRWYTGSIWIVMGMHTMWNFTQNFIFGLPNSGLVSEASIFSPDAATGVSNLIYDYGFGVEGALPAIIFDVLVGIVCLLLAKKNGRLGELKMSYEKEAALSEQNSAVMEIN